MIYRPLLVAKHTMTEHSMNSKEVNISKAEYLDYADILFNSTTIIGKPFRVVLIRLTISTPQYSAQTGESTKKREIFVDVKSISSV